WAALAVVLTDRQTRETTATLFAPANLRASLGAAKQDGIYSLAYSPDGRWLVAGTRYGHLHRWDLTQDPPKLVSWPGHQARVTSLLFRSDGTALFSASDKEKVVQRWAVAAWEQPLPDSTADRRFTAEGNIVSLSRHPTEGWLICGTEGGQLCFLSA